MAKKFKVQFLKNRHWRSHVRHRLKGKPEEVSWDFENGLIERPDSFIARKQSRKNEEPMTTHF